MTTPNEQQPAYPTFMGADSPGLTKRELFAAMAMNGLLSTLWTPNDAKPEISLTERYAMQSVILADALLAELDKENVCECNQIRRSTGNFCPYCGRKIKEVK